MGAAGLKRFFNWVIYQDVNRTLITMKKIAQSQRHSGNIAAAQRTSAKNRECPKCHRKAALASYRDEMFSGTYCRWPDCDYTTVKLRG